MTSKEEKWRTSFLSQDLDYLYHLRDADAVRRGAKLAILLEVIREKEGQTELARVKTELAACKKQLSNQTHAKWSAWVIAALMAVGLLIRWFAK